MLGSTAITDDSGLVGKKFNQLIPNIIKYLSYYTTHLVTSEQIGLVFATSEQIGLIWLCPNNLCYSVRFELWLDAFSLFPYPLVPMQLPPNGFPSNYPPALVLSASSEGSELDTPFKKTFFHARCQIIKIIMRIKNEKVNEQRRKPSFLIQETAVSFPKARIRKVLTDLGAHGRT